MSSEWVKAKASLMKGAWRGVPRATRFVLLELAIECRPLRGSVALPLGMDPVDGVCDLLGGSRREVRAALALLTSGASPTVVIRSVDGRHVLTIPSWGEHNTVDSSADRTRRYRERIQETGTRDASQASPGDADVTALEERRGEKRRSDPSGGSAAGPAGSAAPQDQAPEPARTPTARKRPFARSEQPSVTSAGPTPETATQIAWRSWRAEYQRTYRRPYPPQSTDGPAMGRAVKLAVEFLRELGRPSADLEALLVHRWRRYLRDPGRARVPGGPGFLAETAHALQHFEKGIAAYGSPWDREIAAASAPPATRREPPADADPLPPRPRYTGRSSFDAAPASATRPSAADVEGPLPVLPGLGGRA